MKRIIGLIAVGLIPAIVFGQEKNLIEETTKEQYVPKVIIEAKVGNGEGEFGIVSEIFTISRGPNAIAVDEKGNIYILDPVNTRVVKFDKEGKYLKAIYLEQRRIKIKTKNPVRLFAEKNPKFFKDIYKKSPEDYPEYEEREINAINFLTNFPEIQVDDNENIYYISDVTQHPQCFALVVYDKNGKIIDKYTPEEIGMRNPSISHLSIDENGNVVRFISSEDSSSIGVEINRSTKEIKKFNLSTVDDEIKNKKFKYNLRKVSERKIRDLSSLPHKLRNLIEKSRSSYGSYRQLAQDDEGNIYEIVWIEGPLYLSETKGITKIVWDKKTLPEGVKVIKWMKVK
jgi:hypothetical protein